MDLVLAFGAVNRLKHLFWTDAARLHMTLKRTRVEWSIVFTYAFIWAGEIEDVPQLSAHFMEDLSALAAIVWNSGYLAVLKEASVIRFYTTIDRLDTWWMQRSRQIMMKVSMFVLRLSMEAQHWVHNQSRPPWSTMHDLWNWTRHLKHCASHCESGNSQSLVHDMMMVCGFWAQTHCDSHIITCVTWHRVVKHNKFRHKRPMLKANLSAGPSTFDNKPTQLSHVYVISTSTAGARNMFRCSD
jgi:hypothetical protein